VRARGAPVSLAVVHRCRLGSLPRGAGPLASPWPPAAIPLKGRHNGGRAEGSNEATEGRAGVEWSRACGLTNTGEWRCGVIDIRGRRCGVADAWDGDTESWVRLRWECGKKSIARVTG